MHRFQPIRVTFERKADSLRFESISMKKKVIRETLIFAWLPPASFGRLELSK
jgi:hypothetical protein